MKLSRPLVFLLVSTSAAATHAATITLFGTGTRASALAAEAAYLSPFLSPDWGITTDTFEGQSPTEKPIIKDGNTGIFAGVTPGNSGIGAGCEPFCSFGMAFLDRAHTPFSGRFAIEDDGSAIGLDKIWLDSNDFKVVSWTRYVEFDLPHTVGFFLTDLSDEGALFHINVTDGRGNVTSSGTLTSGLPSGTYFYLVATDNDGIRGIELFSDAGTANEQQE
jgi:hypothetical protein